MRSSTPPGVPPKFTVTNEHGDIEVSIRAPLTPEEARDLACHLFTHAVQADAFRLGVIGEIVDASRGITDHEGATEH
jgi:hypothetical protein